MLAALSGVEVAGKRPVCDRLARFLVEQRSAGWSFNYWAKTAAERRTQPYPDDLDDTFCALIGLLAYNPSLVDEAALAKIVKLLLATETATGGPYRTWLVPPTAPKVWLDSDLAVNSNIAYFLSLVSKPLPNLNHLMGRAVIDNELLSAYYPSPHPLAYYLARAYQGPQRAKLTKLVRQLLHNPKATALERALCLTALMKLGENQRLDSGLASLLALQQPDGCWPAAAFCIDPARDGQPYYHGAPVLTTAFALETLRLYLDKQAKPAKTKPTIKRRSGQTLQTKILNLAEWQCQSLAPELRDGTLKQLNRVAAGANGPEIMLLPYRFNQTLAKPLAAAADNFFAALGLANLYGWLAYSIYDDFLDDEGKPAMLPLANVAMRNSLSCFAAALPGDQAFLTLVRQTFDKIDGANAWELANCRWACQGGQVLANQLLPDYGDLSKLAERSLGHSLTPLAVLLARGFQPDSQAHQQVQQALAHYLIARQLNDDAHDWQDDIRAGQITYVVGTILSGLNLEPGKHALDKLLPKMQQQFWHHSLPLVCEEMRRQANLSRQAMLRSSILEPTNVISSLLDAIDKSIDDTLAKQTQARGFLKHYKQKVARP
jgi:hypothetical protein